MTGRREAARRSAQVLRVTIGTLGELLVTAGMLAFLFVVYQLFYTNVVGHQVMWDEVASLHRLWTAARVDDPAARSGSPTQGTPILPIPLSPLIPAIVSIPSPASAVAPPPSPVHGNGDAVAILHIPRLGTGSASDGVPVLEGVGLDVLNKATGHYPRTAPPGQVGNFSVAGHRKTHGEPFRHLDAIRAGDLVIVETADVCYTYQVNRDPFIVQPTDVDVVDPVPNQPGAAQTGRLITLTTCDPWWGESAVPTVIVVGLLMMLMGRKRHHESPDRKSPDSLVEPASELLEPGPRASTEPLGELPGEGGGTSAVVGSIESGVDE